MSGEDEQEMDGALKYEEAEQYWADGVEALNAGDYHEAADVLAQCLQFHAGNSGDTSIDAAVVSVKYASALLGCARTKEQSLLGDLQSAQDSAGPSTSKGTGAAPQVQEDESAGDDDLELAWEVAETARLGIEQNVDSKLVNARLLTETYQLLGDIGAERELFSESVEDYEKALSCIKDLEEPDVRWEAEIHFKVSIALELADRGAEAEQHIQLAISMMSKLLKEKQAMLKELDRDLGMKGAAQAAAPSATETTPREEQPSAPETTAAPEPESATPAGASPAKTQDGPSSSKPSEVEKRPDDPGQQTDEKEEDVDEVEVLRSDIKSLQEALKGLEEHHSDLIDQKKQEAAIKAQLKAALGSLGAIPADTNGAGPSTAQPNAPAAEADAVQDLGVISSKRKRAEAEELSAKCKKPSTELSEAENVDVSKEDNKV